MPNVCVPGILGVLAWDENFWGFATAPVQKLGSMNGFRLPSQIFETRRAESEFYFCIHPRLFLENRKPCFQLGTDIKSIVRRENLLLFRCSASFGRCDLAVYSISSLKKLVQ